MPLSIKKDAGIFLIIASGDYSVGDWDSVFESIVADADKDIISKILIDLSDSMVSRTVDELQMIAGLVLDQGKDLQLRVALFTSGNLLHGVASVFSKLNSENLKIDFFKSQKAAIQWLNA